MAVELCIPDPALLSVEALRALLIKQGARIDIRDRADEIVARWPIRPARVRHDARRVVVFRMNERGEWRGVLMVGAQTPNAYDLIAQETHFRDLSHVMLWLGAHEPKSCWPAPFEITPISLSIQ